MKITANGAPLLAAALLPLLLLMPAKAETPTPDPTAYHGDSDPWTAPGEPTAEPTAEPEPPAGNEYPVAEPTSVSTPEADESDDGENDGQGDADGCGTDCAAEPAATGTPTGFPSDRTTYQPCADLLGGPCSRAGDSIPCKETDAEGLVNILYKICCESVDGLRVVEEAACPSETQCPTGKTAIDEGTIVGAGDLPDCTFSKVQAQMDYNTKLVDKMTTCLALGGALKEYARDWDPNPQTWEGPPKCQARGGLQLIGVTGHFKCCR